MASVHGERLKTTLAYSLEAPSTVAGPSASWARPMRKGQGGEEMKEGEGRRRRPLGLNLGCGPAKVYYPFLIFKPLSNSSKIFITS